MRKTFFGYACNNEITLAETIIHDFKGEWSSNKDKHYHECKNCDVIKDEAAHRPTEQRQQRTIPSNALTAAM